jgi:hypothetical protein
MGLKIPFSTTEGFERYLQLVGGIENDSFSMVRLSVNK